jgi:GT2 family glycosyltransferase
MMNNSAANQILILIVLYKKSIEECVSYRTLKDCIKSQNLRYKLIIYNNSSEYGLTELEDAIVINSDHNGRLSSAYNYAWKYALAEGYQWLLLLDQDSELSEDYFTCLSNSLQRTVDDSIVALVPKLVDGNQILSPRKISSVGWWENTLQHTGIQRGRVVAFNSLSLLNVNFIQSIGGFSDKYPLDMLDHWYYNQIYLQKKKVYVLDCMISHNLSFQNYERDVDLVRHTEFLEAERLFVKELGLRYYVGYKVKLFLRVIKQYLIFEDKRYATITLKKLVGKGL